jgi:hypothetical protein
VPTPHNILRRTFILTPFTTLLPAEDDLTPPPSVSTYQRWFDAMAEWQTLLKARTSQYAYSLQEFQTWRKVRETWRDFESKIDNYYKGRPN